MKKILFMILPLLLCVGLWGCGKQAVLIEETTVVSTQSQSAAESTETVESVEGEKNEVENTVEIDYDEAGTMVQTYYDEAGNMVQTYDYADGSTSVVCIAPDGSRTETRNNLDGSMVSIYNDPATGEYIETEFSKDFVRIREKGYYPDADRYTETEYYENGNLKWTDVREPASGFISQQEYYENGNSKEIKIRQLEVGEEMDAQYNEEGYCTYYRSFCYIDREPYEIECFGDENGRLIKIVENGEETDDTMLYDLYIQNCNFRK